MKIQNKNPIRILKGGNRLAPLSGIFTVLVIISAFLFSPVFCLTAESGGKLLFALPIKSGECFEVKFIHSLNLSPVTDVIEWTGSQMMVRKTLFESYGAGIPVLSDGIGSEFAQIDGHYELTGIDKPMQSFGLMTQTIPDHYIFFKESEISLLELVGSGKLVNITVQPVSRIKRIVCGFS